MNLNKNSIVLGTLLLKGPLTRPTLWSYVSRFNFYSGLTNLKLHMHKMVKDNRITRKVSPLTKIKGQEIFEYSIVQGNERNTIPQEILDKIKTEIDTFDELLSTTTEKK
ncbi:hypothetical protein RB653_005909 [Dictyostelium firmibasis]|uniref:Uncharacterized protein n=1 Tax=Dictyostelium firmibasis TaxID=79012 RepID=A0AAN7YZQ3_9MYCE